VGRVGGFGGFGSFGSFVLVREFGIIENVENDERV
jgi:hypothetical protein